MKKTAPGAFALILLLLPAVLATPSAASRFRKLSPHFYYLESATGAANTGAVITEDGVLLIDPPPESEISALLNALKAVTTRQVRWVVCTDYRKAGAAGMAAFLKLGAAVIGSKELDRLASSAAGSDRNPAMPPSQPANPRFVFGRQLHLFPAGMEIRVLAVRPKARTAGDVIVFLPSEKVLVVGDLFTPSSYPAIDPGAGEGNAVGWIEGLKQAIETVPLLKSAMPQPKQELPPSAEPEKTLEESVVVVPAHGAPANLQQMKDLLAVAQKLKTEAGRALANGRTRDDFVRSVATTSFGDYGNLEAFASQLFDDLPRK